MIIDVNNILVSSDIFKEQFCCDLDKCKGICCVEGDAGAPVTLDEIGATCQHKPSRLSTAKAWPTQTATATL